jgi:membrane associated rhomboid family serine protease
MLAACRHRASPACLVLAGEGRLLTLVSRDTAVERAIHLRASLRPLGPGESSLLVVPVLLFLVSMHFTHYDVAHLAVNIATLAVLIVPKLPEMHEMRFFGINAGPSVEVEQ